MGAASHIARRGRPAALTPFRHVSKKRDVPMKKTFAALMAFSFLASPATAHEVWVERDAAGPARIYLGEPADPVPAAGDPEFRSEEHTSELQSLMRISYAVFCLKKKK